MPSKNTDEVYKIIVYLEGIFYEDEIKFKTDTNYS